MIQAQREERLCEDREGHHLQSQRERAWKKQSLVHLHLRLLDSRILRIISTVEATRLWYFVLAAQQTNTNAFWFLFGGYIYEISGGLFSQSHWVNYLPVNVYSLVV